MRQFEDLLWLDVYPGVNRLKGGECVERGRYDQDPESVLLSSNEYSAVCVVLAENPSHHIKK